MKTDPRALAMGKIVNSVWDPYLKNGGRSVTKLTQLAKKALEAVGFTYEEYCKLSGIKLEPSQGETMELGKIASKIAGSLNPEQEKQIAQRVLKQALETLDVAGAEGYQDLFPELNFEDQDGSGQSPSFVKATQAVKDVILKMLRSV